MGRRWRFRIIRRFHDRRMVLYMRVLSLAFHFHFMFSREGFSFLGLRRLQKSILIGERWRPERVALWDPLGVLYTGVLHWRLHRSMLSFEQNTKGEKYIG